MINHERWLYQENSLSQQLMMLYLAGNTAFTIFYANNVSVDYRLGIFIMLNIFLSLIAFLVAVRLKVYSLQWGYAGIMIGVFQWLRLLWLPEEFVSPLRFWLQALLVVSGFLAIAGSIICLKRTRERQRYLVENQIDLTILQR